MGKIKLRLEGATEDVKAFARLLRLMDRFINAISLKSESVDYPNHRSSGVRRYFDFEFDSEVIGGE